MKAAVCEAYGHPEFVRIVEIPKPSPAPGEVLIRTHSTTVSSADWRLRSGQVPRGFGFAIRLAFGIRKLRQPVLGAELSGTVEAVGDLVTDFKVGDEVFAFCDSSMGCHAEFKCVSASGAIALKPENLSFEEAAALSFGGTTALSFFERGGLKSGETLLINGASGAVGSAAVQIACNRGAEVTGVCSGQNAELVRSLGATHVIDYQKEDFSKNGKKYDLILDTVGTAPLSHCKNSFNPGGRLLLVLADLSQILAAPFQSLGGKVKVIAGPANVQAKDVRLLAQLAAFGAFRPVVDRVFPFDQIVEAHRLVETGRKRGNVVVDLD